MIAVPLFAISYVAHAGEVTAQIPTTQDALVDEENPTTNYGSLSTLNVESTISADMRSFIYFSLASLPDGIIITNATLKLYCSGSSGLPRTYQVQRVSVAWQETGAVEGINWNNQPSVAGTVCSATISGGGWWQINVYSAYIDGAGISFRVIDSTEDEDPGGYYAEFHSREAANDAILEITYEEGPYFMTFHGVYDEVSGEYFSACNVTAVFSGYTTETFEVNDTKVKGFTVAPDYLIFDLSPYDREFWFNPSTDNMTDIYIYNDEGAMQYTIMFNDLAGKLGQYRYVEAQTNVNGTMTTVEKRKLDEEDKIVMNLVEGRKYTLILNEYTFGEVFFSNDVVVELNVIGLQFPENIIVGYRYVQVYANRDMTGGTINVYYNDELDETSVTYVYLFFQTNDSLAYSTSSASNPWVLTYTGADSETDYYIYVEMHHETFGVMSYRQVLPMLMGNGSPFVLDVLGNLPFDTAYLIPAFIVLCVAASFSALNTAVGLFATVSVATIFGILGWLPLSVDLLVFAFAIVIIFGIVYLRRHVYQ